MHPERGLNMAKEKKDTAGKLLIHGAAAAILYWLWKRRTCPACGPIVEVVEHGDQRRASPVGRISVPYGEDLIVEINNGYLDAMEVQLDGAVITDGTYSWGSYFQSEGARIVLTSVTLDHRIDLTYTPTQLYSGR
jgi:hypothetical protein